MKLRQALETLTLKQLSSVADRAGLARSGSKDDLLSRVARSFGQRGGFPTLVEALDLTECRRILDGFVYSDDEAEWSSVNLSRIRHAGARELLLDLHALEEESEDPDYSAICRDSQWASYFKETRLSPESEEWCDDEWVEEEHSREDAWVREVELEFGGGLALPGGLTPFARTLRHQEESHHELLNWWAKSDARNGAMVLPTGSGKSLVAARFALKVVLARGGTVLWLAHRGELVSQAVKTVLRVGSEKFHRVGRFEAGNRKLKQRCDVVVASIPTLSVGKRGLPNLTILERIQGKPFDLVVVDECHHLPAKTWTRLAKGLGQRMPEARFLGLTATPFRSDESEEDRLRRFFPEVHRETPRRLVEERVLARPHIKVVPTNCEYVLEGKELVDYRKFHDLSAKTLERLAATRERNQLIVNTVAGRTDLRPQDGWGPSLVFCTRTSHADSLAKMFRASGVEARAVHGGIDADERAAALRAFEAGEIQVLTTVAVLTEGTDLPKLKSVFIARPTGTSSRVLFAQMVGRAMRGPEVGGTEICHVVGFNDRLKEQADEYLDGQPVILELPDSFMPESAGYETVGLAEEEPAERPTSPVATAGVAASAPQPQVLSPPSSEASPDPLLTKTPIAPPPLEHPSPAVAHSSPVPLEEPAQRPSRRRVLVGAAAGVVALLGGVAWWFSSSTPATSQWAGKFLELGEPKYLHTVSLNASGEKFEGTYFYNQRRLVLDLRGWLKGREFELEETMSGKKTGTFRGQISSDWSHATGKWTHVDGRVLTFEWTRTK